MRTAGIHLPFAQGGGDFDTTYASETHSKSPSVPLPKGGKKQQGSVSPWTPLIRTVNAADSVNQFDE